MKLPGHKYVYVLSVWKKSGMLPFSYPVWIGKVGFSYDAKNRAADVERSIWQITGEQVYVRTFFFVPVFMYRPIEKAIHTVLKPYRSGRFALASGGSEFFTVLNPFSAGIALLVMWGIGAKCAHVYAALLFLFPLPVDFALFVLLLASVEYSLYFFLIWLFFSLL
jgi:hypothetical protein